MQSCLSLQYFGWERGGDGGKKRWKENQTGSIEDKDKDLKNAFLLQIDWMLCPFSMTLETASHLFLSVFPVSLIANKVLEAKLQTLKTI